MGSARATGAGYLALAGPLLYLASFAIGLGPVSWLMISEIDPAGIRGKAMAVSTVANWGADFLVADLPESGRRDLH
jgi:Sugar (and other) transporter